MFLWCFSHFTNFHLILFRYKFLIVEFLLFLLKFTSLFFPGLQRWFCRNIGGAAEYNLCCWSGYLCHPSLWNDSFLLSLLETTICHRFGMIIQAARSHYLCLWELVSVTPTHLFHFTSEDFRPPDRAVVLSGLYKKWNKHSLELYILTLFIL